jgi:hypothetical protein
MPIVEFEQHAEGKSTMGMGLIDSGGKSTMGTGLIDSGPQTPQPKQVKTVKEEPSVTDKLFATPKAEPYEPAELDPLQPYPKVVTDDNGALLLRFSDRKTKWYEKTSFLRRSNTTDGLVVCKVATGEVIYATALGVPLKFVPCEAKHPK